MPSRTRSRWSLPLVAGVLAAVLLAPPAQAQIDAPITDPLGAVDAWANAETLRRLLPDGDRAGRENRKSPARRERAPRATRRQLKQLRFTRDAQVTERNRQAVIDEFTVAVDPAVVVADIERNRKLAHELMRSFDGHWSPNDLADVASFVLLSSYAGYNDRTRLSAAGCLAVRKAARHGLARRRSIRRTPKAEKQTAAEMSEIRMTYQLAELSRARAEGDNADIEIARAAIRTWAREVYGLDVASARLTKRGFRTLYGD